ncbi:Adenylosuccinate synthetase, organellar chromatophore [Streptomyces griseoloalbus]
MWCATRAATTPATRWSWATRSTPWTCSFGILSPGCTPVIGNGVVVDPSVLLSELSGLNERGVDTSKLLISGNAHIITPYNVTVDKVTERFLGKRKIGTTGRGIGPTYADKINRVGIRVQDLYDESILTQKVEAALDVKNQMLTKLYNRRAIAVDQVVEELLGYADKLAPYVADTVLVLNEALEQDKVVLFEGGQGTLLDIDHGTYPFVTSSNPTAGGACTGAGVGPTKIGRVIGILQGVHQPGVTRAGAAPDVSCSGEAGAGAAPRTAASGAPRSRRRKSAAVRVAERGRQLRSRTRRPQPISTVTSPAWAAPSSGVLAAPGADPGVRGGYEQLLRGPAGGGHAHGLRPRTADVRPRGAGLRGHAARGWSGAGGRGDIGGLSADAGLPREGADKGDVTGPCRHDEMLPVRRRTPPGSGRGPAGP